MICGIMFCSYLLIFLLFTLNKSGNLIPLFHIKKITDLNEYFRYILLSAQCISYILYLQLANPLVSIRAANNVNTPYLDS